MMDASMWGLLVYSCIHVSIRALATNQQIVPEVGMVLWG